MNDIGMINMIENPLISIILPVYNVELYLAECLDSVLAQTYTNYELIAVNDGSTDKSLDILLSYQHRFGQQLIIIEQENKGLSAARNIGLDNANGELIYFLDSDDWILLNTLKDCVNTFVRHNSDLVVFNAKAFCDDMPEDMLNGFDYSRNLPNDIYTKGHDLFNDSRKSEFYIVQSCCYMYKFRSNPDLRFIYGILHEDNYFTTMLFLTSSNTSVLPDRFFQRRIRKNSITTSSLSLRHAIGYYKSAERLSVDLTKKNIHSLEVSNYYNYLIQSGFNIEYKVSNGSVALSRKLKLIYQFRKIINYKVFLRVLIPTMYEKILKMLRKFSLLK